MFGFGGLERWNGMVEWNGGMDWIGLDWTTMGRVMRMRTSIVDSCPYTSWRTLTTHSLIFSSNPFDCMGYVVAKMMHVYVQQ